MPSTKKVAKACPQCYIGIDMNNNCSKCGSEGQVFTFYKLTIPKKNNRRAWKRMFNGERLWDRRRVKREKVKRGRHEKPREVDFGG